MLLLDRWQPCGLIPSGTYCCDSVCITAGWFQNADEIGNYLLSVVGRTLLFDNGVREYLGYLSMSLS